MSQDRDAAFVVPIVQDLRQQIGIAAGRNLNKEIPADDLAAIRHTRRREMLRGGSGHVRLIEQELLALTWLFRRIAASNVP